MKRTNKVKGNKGEELVVNFLLRNNYRIIERNYRIGKKEIDIIAKKDDIIIFIEVKLRSNIRFGTGLEAVNYRKQENIRRASIHYLLDHGYSDSSVRFDVASVDDGKLTYIENAF